MLHDRHVHDLLDLLHDGDGHLIASLCKSAYACKRAWTLLSPACMLLQLNMFHENSTVFNNKKKRNGNCYIV